MRSEPIKVLESLLASEGDRIVRDPERCEALLTDGCGECKKEIAILVSVVKCQAALELARNTAPYASLRTRLIQRIQDDQGLSADAAAWGIDAWHEALTGRAPELEPVGPPQQPLPVAGGAPHPDTAIRGIAPADQLAREWRSGEETPGIRGVMTWINSHAGSDVSPESLRDQLIRHGLPTDVVEQMLLKASPNAGGTTLAGGVGLLAVSFFVLRFDVDIPAVLMLLMGVVGIVVGVYQRRRWRQWTMSLALRKTGK